MLISESVNYRHPWCGWINRIPYRSSTSSHWKNSIRNLWLHEHGIAENRFKECSGEIRWYRYPDQFSGCCMRVDTQQVHWYKFGNRKFLEIHKIRIFLINPPSPPKSSVIHSTLIGIELMAKHKNGSGGHIINIASIAGLAPLGNATLCVYAASKYGVVGFTRALAVRINPFSIIWMRILLSTLTDEFIAGRNYEHQILHHMSRDDRNPLAELL